MTITQTIDELPDAPDPASDSADEFSDKAAASVLAQKNMVPQLNTVIGQMNSTAVQVSSDAVSSAASAAAAAISQASASASAASAIASPSTNGTSSNSITIGSGTISFTTQAGKNWAVGMWVNIARTSDATKSMSGPILSYNSGNGATQVSVAAGNISGSGTFADWTITVSGQPGSIFNLVDLSLLGPSIRPSLLADFANAKRLDSRFTYTMTSPLTYTDAAGILRYAPPGVPAFDHDPVTGKCVGWSVWETRTNVLLYSEQFDNAAWTKFGASVSTNAAVSPDGATTADKLVEDSANTVHHVYASANVTSGSGYTFSLYVKAAGRTKVSLRFNTNNGAFADSIADFDLTAGTVTNISCNSASMQNVGNGWWRCTATETALASALGFFSVSLNNGSGISYAGDGTSGAHLWGAQVEAGAFVTPYIPTTSGAITRFAPTLTMALSSFEFNALEATIYAEFESANATTAFPFVWMLHDGSNANRINLVQDAANDVVYGELVASSANTFASNGFAPYTGARARIAMAYKANDAQIAKDGTSNPSDTSVVLPPGLTTLSLGNNIPGTAPLNGYISKFALYPKRLPQAELVALSTL